MSKYDKLRRIDSKPARDLIAGIVPGQATSSEAGAPLMTGDAPRAVTLTAALATADQSATAVIGVAITDPGDDVRPVGYTVQYATDAAYTANVGGFDTIEPFTSIAGLTPNTAYYVRAKARYSGIDSAWTIGTPTPITTPIDTAPPASVTSLTAGFTAAGDLVIAWVNPASANLRDVEVVIRDAPGGTIRRTLFVAGTSVVYPHGLNRLDTSSSGDPTLTVDARARSRGGFFASVVSASAVAAVPGTPGSVTTDFTGPDARWRWTRISGVRYQLTIDGVAREVGFETDEYLYPLALNRVEHSGTPDPVLTWSLVAVDAFGQTSPAAAGTATNAAPSAPSSVTVTGFFATLGITVAATIPGDFLTFRYRIIQTLPSSADVTYDAPLSTSVREKNGAATYQVGVRVIDVFAQTSAETFSAATALDGLVLADLRAHIVYSDSISTNTATLRTQMSDDNLASGGVIYAGNAGWTQWIRADRLADERVRTVTLGAVNSGGVTTWYIRTSSDGVTWQYFAGPVTASRILTLVASEAAARAAEVGLLTLGVGSATRADLPGVVRARYVELWLRNTNVALSTTIREFFPRSLVQADDIEAESIKAINIGAGAITADKILAGSITATKIAAGSITATQIAAGSITATQIAAGSITADRLNVSNLSAISANLGTITAGTITGAQMYSPYIASDNSVNPGTVLTSEGLTFHPGNQTINNSVRWETLLEGATMGFIQAREVASLGGDTAHVMETRALSGSSFYDAQRVEHTVGSEWATNSASASSTIKFVARRNSANLNAGFSELELAAQLVEFKGQTFTIANGASVDVYQGAQWRGLFVVAAAYFDAVALGMFTPTNGLSIIAQQGGTFQTTAVAGTWRLGGYLNSIRIVNNIGIAASITITAIRLRAN